MADESNTSTESEDTSTEEAPPEQSQESSEESPETSGPQSVEELPDWAQKQLKKAQTEAAKYRNRAKETHQEGRSEAESEAQEAYSKLQTDYENVLFRASSAEDQLTRYRVAVNSGVDPSKVDDFAARLRGDSEEDLQADAEKLKETLGISGEAPAPKPDPSQASGGNGSMPLNGDPILDAVKGKLGI